MLLCLVHRTITKQTAMPALKRPENKWLYYAPALFIQCGHYWALARRPAEIWHPLESSKAPGWLFLIGLFAHLVRLRKDHLPVHKCFAYVHEWISTDLTVKVFLWYQLFCCQFLCCHHFYMPHSHPFNNRICKKVRTKINIGDIYSEKKSDHCERAVNIG